MPMESKVAQLIDLAEVITDIKEQTEDTPVVLWHTLEKTSQTIAIVCSQVEPINMVLPLNVIWVCFKIESAYYKQAFKRVSKINVTTELPFEQTWREIYFYEDIEEPQFFDEQDLALFSIPQVPLASNTNLGKTKINRESEILNAPVFVGDTDYRMSDTRTPVDHQHPEVPAKLLFSGSSVVTISGQDNPQYGQTLIFSQDNTVTWGQINETSIEEGNSD